ncbi:type II and III secretion system protein family protein [Anatilimnocola floriformis]|uniref:type II and III secretion system protein family protein n=1 Tax=Anatilimnocola floriformis TaxID=2948575 RepID=UPI0020C3AF30|nr:pilus assembly protein N-terminal domain-containing protein [Anatilimnocola floriformis]
MLRSSRFRLLTATLCAAGVFTGQLLGQQPAYPRQQLSGAKPQLQRVEIDAAPLAVKPGVEAKTAEQTNDGLAPIVSSANVPRPSRSKPAAAPQLPATPPVANVNKTEGLPLEAILAQPTPNKVEPVRPAATTGLPPGAPASTGPWMQDIREMIRSTPSPNGARNAVQPAANNAASLNKNVAKQVQYEQPAMPAGPPKELIATPIGGAQSAFAPIPAAPPAPAASIPLPPLPAEIQAMTPPAAYSQPAFSPPSFTPPAPAPEVRPIALPVQQLAPAPAPQQAVLATSQPISQPSAQPAAPAVAAKPKKLQHLAPMNPQYEAAAQARGIAQVRAENALPPLSPPGQFNDSQLTPAPSYEPVAPAQQRLQGHPVNLVQQPGALQPPPATTPGQQPVDPRVDAMARAGSPFEVIDETGAVQVMVRRSKLLRTKVDIYRTAVVDDSICEIVQFTPREVSIIGKSQGSTHVTFWFDDPAMQPITYVIQVVPDVAAVVQQENTYKMLQDVINEMFPDSKIQLMIVADKLILRGQAKDSEEAAQIVALVRSQTGGLSQGANAGGMGGGLSEGAAAQVLSDSATGSSQRSRLQVINMIRVPGVQQVALRVKIAEMNRSAARGFGVDVKGHINFTDNTDGSQMFLQSMLNVAAGAGPALLTQVDGDDIQLGVRYLQSHGIIRLLSEPTLVTMSGTPATFIAGGEFAVPTIVGSAGLNAVTTDFRAFGAIISFMPTVIDKDRIRLQVSPEFSQINSALTVGGTPGLKVRAATTTVEMREGQTLAIAGLLEDNMNGTNVGDLPFLSRVFGRRDMSRNETELLILVAPELVHAMEAEEVPPLPGFDVTEPTSAQFFLHGRLEGNPTQDYRSTVWPRLKKRYGAGGPAMTSGPFGHGQ